MTDDIFPDINEAIYDLFRALIGEELPATYGEWQPMGSGDSILN